MKPDMNTTKIGDVILAMGFITEAQLEAALDQQDCQIIPERLGKILISHGACDGEAVAKGVAFQTGLKYANLSRFRAFIEASKPRFPRELATRNRVVPLRIDAPAVVASSTPLAQEVVDELRTELAQDRIECVIASDDAIHAALEVIGAA